MDPDTSPLMMAKVRPEKERVAEREMGERVTRLGKEEGEGVGGLGDRVGERVGERVEG